MLSAKLSEHGRTCKVKVLSSGEGFNNFELALGPALAPRQELEPEVTPQEVSSSLILVSGNGVVASRVLAWERSAASVERPELWRRPPVELEVDLGDTYRTA